MKGFLLFGASFFIGIALFAWVIKFIGWAEIQSVLVDFSGWEGVIILGLSFLIITVASWRWKEILKSQGFNVSFLNLVRAYLASHSVNYLIPTIPFSGDILRGYILKEKLGLPWKISVSSGIIDRILETTAHLIVILIGVIYFLFKIGLPPKNLVIFLGGGFLAAVILLAFFYLKCFKNQSLIKTFFKDKNHKFLEVEKEIIIFFSLGNINFWKGLALAFLRDGASLLRCLVLVFFLGKPLGFLMALSILSFSTLVQLLPIPAVLGSHEIVQVFVFSSMGLGANVGTAFTMIIRVADLTLAFIGIFIIFNFGLALLKKIILIKNNKKIG